MSNITLQIGGRAYTVACDTGQEEHVSGLGRLIDEKVHSIGTGHNEVRQLLFAALILADELSENVGRTTPAPAAASVSPAPDHSAALEAIADRLEKCAIALEG